MAYDETLAGRVREKLQHESHVGEKKMMGGLCFMVNGKMCVGIMKHQLLCRISPEEVPGFLEMEGISPMNFTGRVSKGFLLVDESVIQTPAKLQYWIDKCLAFNPLAKASGKR